MGFILLLGILNLASATSYYCVSLFEQEYKIVADKPVLAPIRQKQDLRIMSWNLNDFFVKSAGFSNARYRQKNPHPKTVKQKNKTKVKRIRDLIERYEPDILVLQEVIGKHSTKSLDRYDLYHHIVATPADARGLQNVFMVKRALHVDVELVLPNAKSGDTHLKRGLPTILLRQKNQNGYANPKNDPDLIVMGVHLKAQSRGRDKLNAQIKRDEAQMLYQAQKILQKLYPKTPMVAMGDFNLHMPRMVPIHAAREVMDHALRGKVSEADPADVTYSYFIKRGKKIDQAEFAGGHSLDVSMQNAVAQRAFLGTGVVDFVDAYMRPITYPDKDGKLQTHPQELRQARQALSDHKPIVVEYDISRLQ